MVMKRLLMLNLKKLTLKTIKSQNHKHDIPAPVWVPVYTLSAMWRI
jgi:hypothetical protein